MPVSDVIPCADGHAQERALIDQVLPLAQEGDVWVFDRNFCAAGLPLGVRGRRAFFVGRRRGNTAVVPQGDFSQEVETDTGWASGRKVWACRDDERVPEARLVRVRLKQPTGDGDLEVGILTNLPAGDADAAGVARLYLKRWEIEGAFHELTVALSCEVNTLGYPRAALFGFCVAVAAYNVLAVVKAAMRGVQGEEKVRDEVSGYYVALEWALVYAGMMIALPAEEWEVFGTMSAKGNRSPALRAQLRSCRVSMMPSWNA